MRSETVGAIILLGLPGSGKGTQALEIQKQWGVPEISTGDLLRDQVKRATTLGRLVEAVLREGGLVPDTILDDIISERLTHEDCEPGCILDGYPRTNVQAAFLDELLRERGRRAPRALLLDVPVERLVERLTERRSCPECGAIYNIHLRAPKIAGHCDIDGAELLHRADDQLATVKHRIETFQHETAPVIEHYRSLDELLIVNADRKPELITAEVLRILGHEAAAA